MVRVVPYAAIQFATHEEYKHLLAVDRDGCVFQVVLKAFVFPSRKKTPILRAIAGSMAGATATSLTYPLDTAKARLSVSSKKEYKNLRALFANEYKRGGLRTFYRGLTPTLLGVVPYAGTSFFTYETLKLLYLGALAAAPLLDSLATSRV